MMTALKASTLLSDLLPELQGTAMAGIAVSGLQSDSRCIQKGDLFLAYPGTDADGRDYIAQAVARGACAVIAEQQGFRGVALKHSAVPVMTVRGLSDRAGRIAGRFYGNPSHDMSVIGVTGTNGKTTCTQLIASLAQMQGLSASVMGTMGWGCVGSLQETLNTTPGAVEAQHRLAILRGQGVKLLAMEVSSHAVEQGRIHGIRFETAVFTNLSRDHLDYHGTMESYEAAKFALFYTKNLKYRIVNADDQSGLRLLEKLADSGMPTLSYGIDSRDADISVTDYELHRAGIRASVRTPWGSGQLESGLIGEFNLSNLLAVIAVFGVKGWPLQQILALAKKLTPVRGRMELVSTQLKPVVLVDYAHTPDALQRALAATRTYCKGKLWCVFGCGGDRDKGKRSLMGKVASDLADKLVITSDNPRTEDPAAIIQDIIQGVTTKEFAQIESREEAIKYAIQAAEDDDCILIAGKGHESYQQIKADKLPFCDVNKARLALLDREQWKREQSNDW